MEIKLNPLECFLCWKSLRNNTTCATNEEVLSLSKFQFAKQQEDSCKNHLKSDILIKCNKADIKMHRWECENFCSTCFETSETLTVLIEILEDTQRELNSVVDQFNEQILNERCKKLNSSLSANIDSDTGALSDGFSGDDFLNNEEEYEAPDDCSTISNANINNVFKESNKRAFEPKSSKETYEFRPTLSKKRKLENENQGKSTKKSNEIFPRIILEKMSDGVAEIMQAKLIERLITDGIIAQPPPIYKTKNIDFGRNETELGDENKLFVVKPVVNKSKNEISDSVEIKHELGYFDNNSESFQNEEAETIGTSEKESFARKKPTNMALISFKELRINLSRINFAKEKTNFPIKPITTEVVKTTAKVKQAVLISKNVSAEVEINSAQSENQSYSLDSNIPRMKPFVDERLDGDKIKGKLLQYKCETCEFLAASFEEFFRHKRTHNPNQPMKCTKCNKHFKKMRSFFTHMKYHTVNSSYVLLLPPKKRLDVPKVNYKCNYCYKSFTSSKCFNTHQKTKHNDMKQETVQFECKITGKMFWNDNRFHRWNINTRAFECNDCKLRFHTFNKLEFHQTKKVSDEPSKSDLFECHICGDIISRAHLNRHLLKSHKREHRKAEHLDQEMETVQSECKVAGKVFTGTSSCRNINSKPFKCEDCKRRFKTAERLAFHQKKQQNGVTSNAVFFECKICGNIYEHGDNLQHHMRQHIEIKPFKCKACGKCFTKSSMYKCHQKIHISTFDFICERENCGKKFKILQDLNVHKRSHTKQDYLIENDKGEYYQCPNCEKTFRKHCSKVFVNHMLTHELKFVCSICENKFNSKILLDEHHMAEHGNRYPCKLCSLTFRYKFGLAYHVKVIHMESDVHVCEDCGASYKNMIGLNTHRKAQHPKESDPTIKCDKCDRMFFSRVQMRKHKVQSHNYQQCEVCGLTVKNLRQHRLTHNTITFDCDICGKKFTVKYWLVNHKKTIHEGQKKECKQCGKKFNSANNLQLHLRTHTGKKPYECSVCGKRANTKHNINTHMRFHTGEKPYKCDKCGNQFSRKDNLNTHVKKCSS